MRNVNLYICTNCRKEFEWNKEAGWYGSDAMAENDIDSVIFSCSNECKQVLDRKIKKGEIKFPRKRRIK